MIFIRPAGLPEPELRIGLYAEVALCAASSELSGVQPWLLLTEG